MSTDENLNEDFADCLSDGRFTFPLIHAIYESDNDEVFEIVKMKPNNMETKRRCVKILKAIGTEGHCLNVLKALHQKLSTEAKKIGANPYIEMALEQLMDF